MNRNWHEVVTNPFPLLWAQTHAFKFPAVLCLTGLTSLTECVEQTVSASEKCCSGCTCKSRYTWTVSAVSSVRQRCSRSVDEVKILGEAGIFTSRHTAFRARPRRAAVPISHTELWGRRRQDTTATNTQNTGASVTTRDSLHFKKNLLQNLTSLLFYTYKQSRKCVHTDSFSLQDLKAHRLVRRERSTSPPCLWQITPSLDLRGCKPSVRQNLSVTDISSFRSYSEPRDKCVQKCCTWDWLVTECTLECLQQQSGGLKETCGFLF